MSARVSAVAVLDQWDEPKVLYTLAARLRDNAHVEFTSRMKSAVRMSLSVDGADAIDQPLRGSWLWDWDVATYADLLEAQALDAEAWAMLDRP
jgi:hypothetical protein